jgi:hypothetical protein
MHRSVVPDVACRTGFVDFGSAGNELVDAVASRSDSEACSGVNVVCSTIVIVIVEVFSGVSASVKDMVRLSSPT